MSSNGSTGDWCIPDKRGQGTAHRIGVITMTDAAISQQERVAAGDPMALALRYDYRLWDSQCGEVRAAFLFSTLVGSIGDHVLCSRCAASA